MPWIFPRSGEYPSAEKTPPKNITNSCFMALFAVEDESFFLGHVEQVYDVSIVVFVIFSIDEHIIMDGQYTRALGHNVVHPHLEDIL